MLRCSQLLLKVFFFSDDVRQSLELLDSVIGEFDDGLLSASESEFGAVGGDCIEVKIHKRPPPKNKTETNAFISTEAILTATSTSHISCMKFKHLSFKI